MKKPRSFLTKWMPVSAVTNNKGQWNARSSCPTPPDAFDYALATACLQSVPPLPGDEASQGRQDILRNASVWMNERKRNWRASGIES